VTPTATAAPDRLAFVRVRADAPIAAPGPRLWAPFAVASIALFVYGAVRPSSGAANVVADYVFHCGLMALGSVLCFARAAFFTRERGAWLLIGAATAASAAGDTIALAAFDNDPPTLSICDAFWLAFLPFAGIGLALLVRDRFPRPDIACWIERLQAALVVSALGLMALFYPVLASTSGSGAEIAVLLAYPLGDVVVFGSVLGVFALSGFRPGSFWLVLGGGLALFAATDAIYSIQSIHGTYSGGAAIDAGWPAAHLLIGYAALMPRGEPPRVRSDDWRTAILPGAVWSIGVVIQVGALVGFLATGYVAARAFLITAQALLLSKIVLQPRSARRLIVTDSLTGVANRHALDRDLARACRPGSASAIVLCELGGLTVYAREHGRPARDALLVRAAGAIAGAAEVETARLYRLEEGEFYVLRGGDADLARSMSNAVARKLAAAVPEAPARVAVAVVPDEATSTADALALLENRLYARDA